MTTIADSWTQNRVDSPEKALIQIQQHQKANQERQEKRFTRGNKQEKVTPKFVKQKDADMDTKNEESLQDGTVAAALAKLKNIKTKN